MPQIYFDNFPRVNYRMPDDSEVFLTNFTPGIKIGNDARDDISLYAKYTISDGARPDVVSQLIYGTPQYAWTFFAVNEQLANGISAWPLSSKQMDIINARAYDSRGVVTADMHSPVIVEGFDITGNMDGASSIDDINMKRYAPTLEYIPFSYIPGTYSSGAKCSILEYNTGRRQIILDTSTVQGTSVQSLFNATHYKLRRTANTPASYTTDVIAAYGLDTDEYVDDIVYLVLADINGDLFSWSNMRYAPHTFISTDSETGETISGSLYDISSAGGITVQLEPYSYPVYQTNGSEVFTADGATQVLQNLIRFKVIRTSNSSLSGLQWISYEQKEVIENDAKRTIRVVKPTRVAEFARNYFNAIREIQ